MAPGTDPAFQQAMDKLLLQVNADNVLAVHRALQQHADELRTYLQGVAFNVHFGLCGLDPVSAQAASQESFAGKIAKLFDVHWKHWEELDAVATLLRDTARAYGNTDQDISASLSVDHTR